VVVVFKLRREGGSRIRRKEERSKRYGRLKKEYDQLRASSSSSLL